eukprot:429043_1
MSASTEPTFESTLTFIHEKYPHLDKPNQKKRTKTTDKDTVCSLCYLRLIQKINTNEIIRIIFKYRSIRQHYQKCHKKYGNITPKKKGLFYFDIETDKVKASCQDVNIILERMNAKLPPDTNTTDNAVEEVTNTTDNDIEPPPSAQIGPINENASNINDIEPPIEHMQSESKESTNDTYQSTLTSLQSSLSTENYNYIDVKCNEIIKMIPAMESRMNEQLQKILEVTTSYQEKLKEEIQKMKVEME